MDEVKYKKGDIVLFRYGQKIKNGTIVIVDAQGTFFQQEEPSYDIEVTNDLLDQNGLYKHIQQFWIL
jgi:signal peptidase I